MTQACRLLAASALVAVLAACSGVPLASLPRLAALQTELLGANPAELILAIQVDERMVPRAGAVPTLEIELLPKDAGAFEPVRRKLPMRVTTSTPPGLPAAGRGRRWLVYSLDAQEQAELARTRERFAQLRTERQGRSGGSLRVGIAQEGIAVDDPLLADNRWDTWLQTSAQAGFFKLWSGTPNDLKRRAHAPGT